MSAQAWKSTGYEGENTLNSRKQNTELVIFQKVMSVLDWLRPMKKKYTYWKDEDMWIGYFDEFPDYWTQGETEAELKENLVDIY